MTTNNLHQSDLIGTHTIGFFSATIGGPPHGAAVKFDIADALREINKLGFVRSDIQPARYLDTQNNKALYTDVVPRAGDVACFKLCEVNRSDWPQVEEEGIVGPLPLTERQGLMRSTHCIAFKPGLVGAILDSGPSVYRLAGYIRKKRTKGSSKLQIKPLVHQDVIKRLNRFETISLFQLRLSPSQLPVIRGAWDDLDSTFESQLAIWNEQSALEVIVRPLTSSQRSASSSMMEHLTSLAERIGLLSKTSTYKVKGKTEGQAREITLNLLSDALTTEEEVMKIRLRDEALDDESAFGAIERAYQALKTEIAEAEGYIA